MTVAYSIKGFSLRKGFVSSTKFNRNVCAAMLLYTVPVLVLHAISGAALAFLFFYAIAAIYLGYLFHYERDYKLVQLYEAFEGVHHEFQRGN